MRLITKSGRLFTLIAVVGLSLSAAGCTERPVDGTDATGTAPATATGAEAGSNTGGGAEVPASDETSTEG